MCVEGKSFSLHLKISNNGVGPRNMLLLTSCHRGLLRRSAKALFYNVKPLNKKHAQELFCRYAFDLAEPVQGFEYLVEFLEICGGLSSSLKFFGQNLAANHEKTYWKL